jgi:ribosomal protein L11 methyltransferase
MDGKDIIQEWEQFRVLVDYEKSSKTAALLSDILPDSLVVEKNYGDVFPQELDQFQGQSVIYGYYPAERSSEIKPRIIAALKTAGHLSSPEFSKLEVEDWATAWQERYHPIPLGQGLIVVPSWLSNPDPDRLAIYISPGMAFGSGIHPTTQLSLQMLEASLSDYVPACMIDVGCGSGILSIAGAKLGIREVLGVDTDPDAVRISRENAAANQVAAATTYQLGSVKEVLSGNIGSKSYSLVVANIIAPILMVLLEQGLDDLVSRNGKLILSGILTEQVPPILDQLESKGITLREQRQHQGWVALVGEK